MKQTEFGSDFHFVDMLANAEAAIEEIYPDAQLHFSGRSALYRIVESGIERYGWKKLFLPYYYCNEVTDFVSSLPIEILFFDDGPYHSTEPDFSSIDKEGNVYVRVNYFGLSKAPAFVPAYAFSVEDHTHDLVSEWAQNSVAHFCFASLRKSLPIPYGGVVWSPKKLVPFDRQTSANEFLDRITYMKLCAMLMKRLYLEGRNIEKQDFRDLFVKSEQLLGEPETNATIPPVLIDLIRRVPVRKLCQIKRRNYRHLYDCIKERSFFFMPNACTDFNPFGLVYYFDKQMERDKFKSYLINNKIYPAVLWPHQRQRQAIDFSNRSLLIHCDFRYTTNDMISMSNVINQYQNESKSYFSIGKAEME